jgi:hypothetical protein
VAPEEHDLEDDGDLNEDEMVVLQEALDELNGGEADAGSEAGASLEPEEIYHLENEFFAMMSENEEEEADGSDSDVTGEVLE